MRSLAVVVIVAADTKWNAIKNSLKAHQPTEHNQS